MTKHAQDKNFVHRVFQQTADKYPQRVAVSHGEHRLTYGELDRASDAVARHLRGRGCGRQQVVAGSHSPSPEYIIAMLGALKAGALWAPVDSALPERRLQLLLDLARPRFVLVPESAGLDALPAEAEVIPLAICWKQGGLAGLSLDGQDVSLSTEDLEPIDADGDDGCYLMFTSGSTGEPKGIEGRHRGLSHFVHWEIKELALDPSVRVSWLAPPTFDVSLRDLFVPLLAGGQVCIPDAETRNDPAALVDWLQDSGVTLCHMVPSLFRLLTREVKHRLDQRQDSLTSHGADQILPDLKIFGLAGEPLLGEDVIQWMDLVGDRVELVNLYGPSETTLAKVFHRITERPERANMIMPIGQPIANTAVLILQHGRLCPIGKIGEIHIKTPFRSRGYFRRPDLTAQAFIANPLSDDSEDLIYKTGDLGRYLPDRSVEYVGRTDRQVKINGIRIELAEIEVALRKHPAVHQVAVVPYLNDRRETLPACYYTLEQGVDDFDRQQAHGHLAQHLPQWMMPTFFTRLDEMPLNLNGKVDRKALPKPEEMIYARGGYQAPTSELEEQIAKIWGHRLGLKKVGVTTPFFLLGGHSLNATKIVADLCQGPAPGLSLKDFFERPTVRGLAEHIESLGTDSLPSETVIEPKAQGQEGPLSPAQRRFWVMERLADGSGAHNIAAAFYVQGGELDLPALEWALGRLAARHEILRTRFIEIDGEPRQWIEESVDGASILKRIDRADLSSLSADTHAEQTAIRELARRDACRVFDLTEAPLFRVTAVALAAGRHLLLFNIHHILADAWSLEVMVRELSAFYAHRADGLPEPDLPPLAIQYRDYALHRLEHQPSQASADFWHRRLQGMERLDLATDRPRGPVKSFAGAVARRSMPVDLARKLRQFAGDRGVSPFQVLLATFNVFLLRHQNRRATAAGGSWARDDATDRALSADIALGMPVAGREHPPLEHQIGCYLNLLVMRQQLRGNHSFDRLLRQVSEGLSAALEHSSYPFDRLVDELDTDRSPARAPLFDVMIDYQEEVQPRLGRLRLQELTGTAPSSKYDLTLQIVQGEGDRLFLDFEYDTGLFNADTINRFHDRFRRLLKGALEDPELPICRLPLTSSDNEQQARRISPPADLPIYDSLPQAPRTVVEALDRLSRQHPDRPAVVGDADGLVTYGELVERSRRMAYRLLSEGSAGDPGEPVALLAERRAGAVVAFIAALRAGLPVMPLDPRQPEERSAQMAKNLRVLCAPHRQELVSAYGRALVWHAEEAAGPLPEIDPEGLAYVLHTSGSTGGPKGVEISHSSLAAYLAWAAKTYVPQGPAHMPLFTPLTFDLTLTSLLLPLVTGGSIEIVDQGSVQEDLEHIFGASSRGSKSHVNMVKLTPSHIRLLPHLDLSIQGNKAIPGNTASLGNTASPTSPVSTGIQTAIVGGEALEGRHLEILQDLNPRIEIFNEYGPTEATVGCVVARLESPRDIHIGRAIDGAQALVLEPHGSLCPRGVVGELCVSGAGLARGYRNRPQLSQERFVPHPWIEGARLYCTGDLARLRADGNLDYLGRLDDQLKIRGRRIEPAEVEQALLEHAGVAEAVVWAMADPNDHQGDLELVAWVVPGSEPADPLELTEHLQQRLPNWMIPQRRAVLDKLPLTANGKLNRQALPDPFAGASAYGPSEPLAQDEASATESTVAEIWRRVLAVPSVQLDDRFFDLGGHSLKAIRVLTAIEQELGVSLSLTRLFLDPTVRGLAAAVEQATPGAGGDRQAPLPIANAAPAESYPVTPGQRQMWLSEQIHPGTHIYHVPGGLLIEGQVDVEALEQAFRGLIRRHESLRTAFRQEHGEVRQWIHRPRWAEDFQLQRRKSTDSAEPMPEEPMPEDQRSGKLSSEEQVLADQVTELAKAPFDLAEGPLLRARWVELRSVAGIPRGALMVVIHHLVSDAWSIGVLVRELQALYLRQLDPTKPDLAPLRLQYKDYAVDLHHRLQSDHWARRHQDWLGKLRSLPPRARLPTDSPRSGERSFRGERLQLKLNPQRTDALQKLAREQDVTLFMVLTGLVQALLAQITGGRQIHVGTATTGRDLADVGRSQLEGQIGFFVNMLTLAQQVDPQAGLGELMQQIKVTVLEAFAHGDYPFDSLAERLADNGGLADGAGQSALFDVQVSLDNTDQYNALGSFGDSAGWSVRPLEHHLGGSKLDLTFSFQLTETNKGSVLTGFVDYNSDLFRYSTITEWIHRLERLMDLADQSLERPLAEVFPLLLDETQRRHTETLAAAALAPVSDSF